MKRMYEFNRKDEQMALQVWVGAWIKVPVKAGPASRLSAANSPILLVVLGTTFNHVIGIDEPRLIGKIGRRHVLNASCEVDNKGKDQSASYLNRRSVHTMNDDQ